MNLVTLIEPPVVATIADPNTSVIQMVQEIVNSLWFLAPATK